MSGYVCICCDGENGPVVQITTSLQTGATVAVCAADIPVALVGGLAAELGVDGDRLYDSIKRWVDREVKRLEAANAALPEAFAQADADRAAAELAAAAADADGQADTEPDELADHDPGPEVDDEGGMSEYRHAQVGGEQ